MAVLSDATASVVITGTRVVYRETDPEVTVRITNDGKVPALVQTWIDDGDDKQLPDASNAPFTIVPPLFRLDPQKGQSLRLMYTREPLPADRESLFWLNVLEVPPRDAGSADAPNVLRLVFRTRIKLFFRPAALPGNVLDAPATVQWRFARNGNRYRLEATNPSPYHVTFTRVAVKAANGSWTEAQGAMVAPHGVAGFDMNDAGSAATGPLEVRYTYLDDYGAGKEGTFREKEK